MSSNLSIVPGRCFKNCGRERRDKGKKGEKEGKKERRKEGRRMSLEGAWKPPKKVLEETAGGGCKRRVVCREVGAWASPSSEDLPIWVSRPSLQMTTDTGSKRRRLEPLLASECCQLAVCRGIGGLNETQHCRVYLQIQLYRIFIINCVGLNAYESLFIILTGVFDLSSS